MRASVDNIFKFFITIFVVTLVIGGCKKYQEPPETIWSNPVDQVVGMLDLDEKAFDLQVSGDQKGSAKVEVKSPKTIRLYETGDINFEDGKLVYEAAIKTRDLKGELYLEMWCVFKDKGEYFSRGLDQKITGDFGWRVIETPFILKKGENPDNVKLNIVVNGTGTVWVDGVKLLGYKK